jgi:stearoyl-CoA desaturase (delta-9 desaturase)
MRPLNFSDRMARILGFLDHASPIRLNQPIVRMIFGMHLLALLACIPWLHSWSGMAMAFAGLYLFGTLGINIGFHRLLTHRGFECPRWLEHTLTVIGVCCWQGTPLNWVAVHRLHHQHSDETPDPHSPRAGFFWSHMGWFLIDDPTVYNVSLYDRYARDLMGDRFYKQLERPYIFRRIQAAQWAAFLLSGAAIGALTGEDLLWDTVQMSLSGLVWGVFVRTVAVWHITWSVNSLSHIWGYRNYTTQDDSKNNWLVGLVSNGEGWHNNHHAEPRSVKNGHRWWELDVSYLTVLGWSWIGLTWNLVTPKLKHKTDPQTDEQRKAA